MTALVFLGGLVALTVGADLLVRGASRIASSMGISPLIVGLTVVAVGTSSPELAVGIGAALVGQADIAVGNVVGSNIFNVLVILGLSALVVPLVVAQQIVRFDVPLLIVCSLLLLLISMDGSVGRVDGALLFSGVIAYTSFLVWQARKERDAQVMAEYASAYSGNKARHWLLNLSLILLGLLLLVFGADWLVTAAVVFARQLGISELVIGLTVIAAGTSLPEVAASVVAAVRGERDIAVGNAIGSSIYNILLVLGMTALVAPAGIAVAQSVLNFDLPVMIAVSVACLPILFTGYRIDRWEGAVFLAYYAVYTGYVVLKATDHDMLGPYNRIMVVFVLPITILTLVVVLIRAWLGPAKPPA